MIFPKAKKIAIELDWHTTKKWGVRALQKHGDFVYISLFRLDLAFRFAEKK